jgi:hypothetical protein
VDFLGPRAIPALVAAVLVALPAAAADCASLEGTYRFTAMKAPSPSEPPETLADFTTGKERGKLYLTEKAPPGGKPVSLDRGEPIRRLKSTTLATKAALKRTPTRTTLQFMDDAGKTLTELGIDELGHWSCKAEHLERHSERVAGLGDSIRTERVEEVLERSASGDLVHRVNVTVLDPKGIKPSSREAVFPAAR